MSAVAITPNMLMPEGMPNSTSSNLRRAPQRSAIGPNGQPLASPLTPGGGPAPPLPPSAGPAPASSVFTPQMFDAGFNGHGGTSGIQSQLMSSADAAGHNENSLVAKNEGILSFMRGNPTDSPLYHSLLSGSRAAIGNSYDRAVENTRASSASRGFGYADPMEQGSEAGVRAEEAGALSAAPSQALEATIAPELAAAGITAGEGSMYAGQQQSDLGLVSALQQARLGKQSSITASIAQIIGDAEKAAGTAAAGAGK